MEKDLKNIAKVALDELMKAREVAKNALIQIVKEHNNFIPLIPTEDKIEVCVFREKDSYDCAVSEMESENIFGLRYVEGEGLFVCTETCLENYEYDNDYDFNFNGLAVLYDEDIEHINKALDNLDYYVDFDDNNIVESTSLISVLSGIQYYL